MQMVSTKTLIFFTRNADADVSCVLFPGYELGISKLRGGHPKVIYSCLIK